MTSSRSAWAISAVAVGLAFLASCGADERGDSTTDPTGAETSAPATGVPAKDPGTTGPSTTIGAPDATSGPPPTTPTPALPPPVFEFSTAAEADGWQVINDTVMGGVSNGELAWSVGRLSFSGELSLANNGGFASIRSPEIDSETASEWAARPGVRVEVEGDGRTWTLQLRTDGDSEGWISTFPTLPEGPTTVELPWATFEPVTRFLEPRSTDEALDPARISAVAFFLVDGIEGPFRLDLRSIG